MQATCALVHFRTRCSAASVTQVACARERASIIGTCSVGVAVMRVQRALVVVDTRYTRASVAEVACASE
jgi:hypothetical protein